MLTGHSLRVYYLSSSIGVGEVQRRYYDTTAELEQQYMNEIGALLADLSDASSEISILNTDMCRKGSTLNVGLGESSVSDHRISIIDQNNHRAEKRDKRNTK